MTKDCRKDQGVPLVQGGVGPMASAWAGLRDVRFPSKWNQEEGPTRVDAENRTASDARVLGQRRLNL